MGKYTDFAVSQSSRYDQMLGVIQRCCGLWKECTTTIAGCGGIEAVQAIPNVDDIAGRSVAWSMMVERARFEVVLMLTQTSDQPLPRLYSGRRSGDSQMYHDLTCWMFVLPEGVVVAVGMAWVLEVVIALIKLD